MKKQRLFYQAIADYKCGEFHLTPVLTLAWPKEPITAVLFGYKVKVLMFGVAIEWGFWAFLIGYQKYKL